jgi:hypothetical protein
MEIALTLEEDRRTQADRDIFRTCATVMDGQ